MWRGFVVEVKLHGLGVGVASPRQPSRWALSVREKFFLKAVTIRSSWAGWRGLALMWENPSFLRRLPTKRSWTATPNPDALEVGSSPAHNAVPIAIRNGLDDHGELGQLLSRQARLGTYRPIVDKPFQPTSSPALKRYGPNRSICQSMPPILAADSRFIPSLTAAKDRSRRLWFTSFDRRASSRSPQPNSPLAISR